MKRARGAVVIETALTVGIGLTVLVFSVQIGILGFLQVTADAASFVDAHGHGIGTLDALGPDHATTAMFQQVSPGDIVNTPQPAPTVAFAFDYSNHGGLGSWTGVSELQPLLSQTTVTPHGVENYLGTLLHVSGQDIEPQWVECWPHFNVVQASTSSACGTSAIASASVNYFTQGENTPPFYLILALRPHCILHQPWTGCMSANRSANWNMLSFGLADFLDVNNWAAQSSGADGTGSSGGQPTSTFEYMACHQRVYAQLSSFLTNYATIYSIYSAFTNAYKAQVNATTGVSDFRYFNEFSTTAGTPSAADNLVREIYNWDAVLPDLPPINAAVEPGGTPLHYGLGC